MSFVNAIIQLYFKNTLFFKKYSAIFVQKLTIMIQRIQSIYLLFAIIIGVIGYFFVPLWNGLEDTIAIAYNQAYVSYAYLASAVLALLSIFMFSNRKRQMGIVKLDIIINLVLLGFLVYWFLNLPGEINFSEKGIWIVGPVLSIVFLIMAHKAIKKDEDLVKSVDRLR